MCFSSPDMPDPVAPPPPTKTEKDIDLNPRRKKLADANPKKAGTRKLQIPLGGINTNGGSGLNVG